MDIFGAVSVTGLLLLAATEDDSGKPAAAPQSPGYDRNLLGSLGSPPVVMLSGGTARRPSN